EPRIAGPARGRARCRRHDAQRGHRRPRPQVPDDERAGDAPRGARDAPARPRVAFGHPACPRGDDRDPRRRRRRRRLGAAAAPEGGRRIGDPLAPDREDRPVTPPTNATATAPTAELTLRRIDLAATDETAVAARRALIRRGAV